MAQYRKDTNQFLPQEKTLFETVMLADQYGNIIGGANPSGMAVDAFGRARVSQPLTLFDSFHRYQDNGKLNTANSAFDSYFVHNANTSSIICNVGTSNGSYVYRESARVFAYQPGKALRHGEPVLTVDGWKNIEDIKEGDKVFDGLGNITDVVGVFPQGKRKIYRFTFDDETYIDADEEHLWVTIIRESGKKGKKGDKRILTTKQMVDEQGNVPLQRLRWRIPASPVLKIETKEVKIDPYTLGAILGDGHVSYSGSVSLTTADEEMLDYMKCSEITKLVNKYGYGLRGLSENIRHYGLEGKCFDEKYVPKEYLYNNESVRLSILQGLMDTDGWIEKDGCCYIATGSKQLSEDIAFIVRSLGGQAKIKYKEKTFYYSKNGTKVECSPSYKVVVIMQVNPFRLSRKANKWKKKYRTSFDRYVYSITEVGEDEATCIRVASDDHTFITKNHIVTHNSLQILQTYVMAPAQTGLRQRYGYFDVNNGIFIEQDGHNLYFVIRNTNGTLQETRVAQADWNIDTLDGTNTGAWTEGPPVQNRNPSGLELDMSKAQIMFLDIEWLGLGTVRCGFVINGRFIHCHSFHHSNILSVPYMGTACLPVRAEIQNTANTSNASNLRIVCTTVISEGGYELRGRPRTAGHEANVAYDLAAAATWYPVACIRLKSDREGAIVIPKDINIGASSSSGSIVKYKVVVGANVSGGLWISGGTDSSVQYNINAASFTGGTDFVSGYVTVTNQASTPVRLGDSIFKYQLERNTFNGTNTVFMIAVQTSKAGDDVVASIDWEEVT